MKWNGTFYEIHFEELQGAGCLNMKIADFIILIVLAFSSNLWAQSGLQIDYRGASITRGVGAAVSLGSRINNHLLRQRDVQRIAQVKTLVALDYFYVTNFQRLRSGSDDEFRSAVRSLLASWTANYDVAVVGLLPVTAELSPALRSFIAGERGSPFRGAFYVLNLCCGGRAQMLNEMLRAEAVRNPKLVLFDWTRAIAAYQQNPDMTPAPSEIYSDMLHLNNKGQVMLFNLALRSVLSQIWNVQLSPMSLN